MFETFKKILTTAENGNGTVHHINDGRRKLEIATCTLFIEVAKADSNFTPEERDKIISYMKSEFGLDNEHVEGLIDLAERNINENDSIYEYTIIINDNFSNDEKYELLKKLWRLIFADNKLDMYEEHIIKKIGGLINMEHRDIIASKLEVKEEMGI
jgi:uncharacterized tellurite resistance protein B-like protein